MSAATVGLGFRESDGQPLLQQIDYMEFISQICPPNYHRKTVKEVSPRGEVMDKVFTHRPAHKEKKTKRSCVES